MNRDNSTMKSVFKIKWKVENTQFSSVQNRFIIQFPNVHSTHNKEQKFPLTPRENKNVFEHKHTHTS